MPADMRRDTGAATSTDQTDVTLSGFTLVAGIVVLALANFMSVLDLTIVNVAIPHIAGGLAVSPNEGTWAITSYGVAEAITVPLTGWLAARFGAVRVFVIAAAAFGLASALCGLSTSLSMLVVFRVLQGVAGGPLMPMSQTLVLRISPPKVRMLGLGLWTMTVILAPVAGPVLGGTIADTIGWPWSFYINVPIAVICAALAWRLLASRETATVKRPIDYVGLFLLVVWVGALQIMLDNGQDDDWFASSFIVGLLVIAVLGFLAFLIWELTDAEPIVDLRVFRYRSFAVSAVAMPLAFGTFFAGVVILPLWLQSTMGYTATSAGELMAFQGMLGLVLAPVTAALMGRLDPRILMSLGLLISAGVAFERSTFNTLATFWQLVVPTLIQGAGMPMFFVPLMAMSTAAVSPAETASAAGLINFLRTMSGAISTAIVTSIWSDSATAIHADLAGRLHSPASTLAQMQATGMSHDQALRTVDNMVQTQSVMLSTNETFLMIGAITLVVALGIWLAPKPKGPLQAGASH